MLDISPSVPSPPFLSLQSTANDRRCDMDDVENGRGRFEREFDPKNISCKIRSSARARDIADRSTLSSADGNVLEQHDQFWRDHKLLLKLFIFLGVMPVTRETGRIAFSWKSFSAAYAVVFYVFTTTLVLFVGRERIEILVFASKKFDEYIYSILFIMYLVPHFLIPFVGWGVAGHVADYKNSWTRFQLKFYRVTGKSLVFPKLSLLIVAISSGCLIVAVVFLLSLSALLAGFTLYHTTAYLHIITMINMNCALWYINCRATGDASKSLADSFEQDVELQCSAYIVAHYRVLWLSLSEILQKLGNAYSRTYSTYSLFMFVNITISVSLRFTVVRVARARFSRFAGVRFHVRNHRSRLRVHV